jgi:hypothetical protein
MGHKATFAVSPHHARFAPRQPIQRQQSRQCVTIIKSSGLRNFAVTPVSLTEFPEIDAIEFIGS